jgi:Fe-S cluster biogenesis protein NfuA
MGQDSALQKQMQRISEVVAQLESTADPNTRGMARDLLESLMAFHGAALERILEIASEAGEAGEVVIRNCARDDLVSSLLLLYGLHPETLHSRVIGALEKSRAYLESNTARAELVSISEDGAVTLRLHLKSNGCGSNAASVKSNLEAAVLNAAPDATSIVVEETGAAATGFGFVPVAQLMGSKGITPMMAGPAQGGSG